MKFAEKYLPNPELTLRDNLWILRYDLIKWYFMKYFSDNRLLNLSAFRKDANLSFLPSPRSHSITNIGYRKREDFRIRKLVDEIGKTNTIFVHQIVAERYSGLLGQALSDYSGIVIFDPTDGEYAERPPWVGAKSKWVAPHIPNPTTSDGLCIPIGLPERVNLVTGNPNNLRFVPWENKKNQVLVGPFGNTHYSRQSLALASYSSDFYVVPRRVAPRRYYKLLSEFKFVLCPRGNGIDTHRFWETLYSGSVPIVEKTDWSFYFREHGVPLVELSSLSDLDSLAEQIRKSYWSKGFDVHDIPALKVNYWKKQINNVWR
jgi:hypothetical protein